MNRHFCLTSKCSICFNITIFLRIRFFYHYIWDIFTYIAISSSLRPWRLTFCFKWRTSGIGLTIFALKVQVSCKPLVHNACLCYDSVITYWHQAIDRLATNSLNHAFPPLSPQQPAIEPNDYIINSWFFQQFCFSPLGTCVIMLHNIQILPNIHPPGALHFKEII